MRKFSVLVLLALVACGTPQEQCINRSTREIRNLQRLLDEVNANIARGYAWVEYQDTYDRWQICGYDTVSRKDGSEIRRPRMCLEDYTVTRRKQVPIDPEAEARKRDGLIAKIKALTPQAEANIAACKTTYPE